MGRLTTYWVVLGAVILVLGLSAPAWAADACACDVQVGNGGNGAVQCNAGTCPATTACNQAGIWSPGNPGYTICVCMTASGTVITNDDCHTVVSRDAQGNVIGITCPGTCPPGKTCFLGPSQCPQTPTFFECWCH